MPSFRLECFLVPAVAAQEKPLPSGDGEALSTRRPTTTYPIVARDLATGQMGMAVQSHWFSVGSDL